MEAIPGQTYTGSTITPAVTVKDGSKTLTLGTDYTVGYSHNIDVSIAATVTVPVVTLDGVVNGDDVSATATGAIDGSNAGTYTSVTLSNLKLKGGEAGNYALANPKGVTVSNVSVMIQCH